MLEPPRSNALAISDEERTPVLPATLDEDDDAILDEDEFLMTAGAQIRLVSRSARNDPTPEADDVGSLLGFYRVRSSVIWLPTRSWMATGSSQHGQSPPMPSDRQFRSQVSQCSTPKERL